MKVKKFSDINENEKWIENSSPMIKSSLILNGFIECIDDCSDSDVHELMLKLIYNISQECGCSEEKVIYVLGNTLEEFKINNEVDSDEDDEDDD